MKTQRLLIVLSVVNFGILMSLLAQCHPAGAQDAAPVLRGRALEIVDGQGRVRASINVLSGGTANGQTYPETVLLRFIDPNGRPPVKLSASVQGAVLGLGGDSDPTHILLKADGASTSMKMTNRDGREQLITP